MIYIDRSETTNWEAVQGSTFHKEYVVKQFGVPVNITGWTAKLGGKRNVNQSALDIDLSTTGGTIVITGATGTVTITATPTLTRAWPVGEIRFQLEFIEGAVVQTYLRGIINVIKEIPV